MNETRKSIELEEVYFSNISAKLLEELANATSSIKVAVAWFTSTELFEILCNKLKQKLKVELIIINDYINNNQDLGLPFQRFIDLGGVLYLKEYPNMMHHKFCIIDDAVLFNGSYNWTYYAETRNDENLMMFKGKPKLIQQFKEQFLQLTTALEAPITKIIPFENTAIDQFERFAIREYLSADVTLKAEKIKQTNAIYANEIIQKAIKIDTKNTIAQKLQKEITEEILQIKVPIADTEFQKELQKIGIEVSNGTVLHQQIKNIKKLDISGSWRERKDIKSLSGIEYFTALTELKCGFNPLTLLDVSKNTTLDCQKNRITSLNVSKNTALTDLIQ